MPLVPQQTQCGVCGFNSPVGSHSRLTVLTTDPTYLVLRSIHNGTPIIAVGINYRLNIFGFGASSDIISAQGNSPLKGVNFGLRDQKIALAWVSRNISAFGGDAQKVTIAGQSAGGSSVHSHLLEAELSSQRPLFRKAIIQSGAVGSLGPTSLSFADKCWEDLCKHWSVDQESGIQRVELLRRIPALDLIRTASELGWGTFPIVVDNSTVRDCTHEADVTIHLGDDDINNKIKAVDRPIQVLLGVTESEVRCCGMNRRQKVMTDFIVGEPLDPTNLEFRGS